MEVRGPADELHPGDARRRKKLEGRGLAKRTVTSWVGPGPSPLLIPARLPTVRGWASQRA